jgi:2-polyprenyl-6-methoxyphenol hydroxylase-like FAD-dependent oxidoreductase
VLIAGAGPVGLSLAIELAYRGVRCLVVDQSDGTVDFPTTNLANTRSVEHLRRWAIAERMRYEYGYPPNIQGTIYSSPAWTATNSRASIIHPTAIRQRAHPGF